MSGLIDAHEKLIDLVVVETLWDDFISLTGVTALLELQEGGYIIATFPPTKKPPRIPLGFFPNRESAEKAWGTITGREGGGVIHV